MTASRAKARKMAARFARPRRRSAFARLAPAAPRLAGAAIIAGIGIQHAVRAAADFAAAYARVRALGATASPAEFAKLRAVQDHPQPEEDQ